MAYSFTGAQRPRREEADRLEETSGLLIEYNGAMVTATLDEGKSWPATIDPVQTVVLRSSLYPGTRHEYQKKFIGVRRNGCSRRWDVSGGYWVVSEDGLSRDDLEANGLFKRDMMRPAHWFILERINSRTVSLGSARTTMDGVPIFKYTALPCRLNVFQKVYFATKDWLFPFPENPT